MKTQAAPTERDPSGAWAQQQFAPLRHLVTLQREAQKSAQRAPSDQRYLHQGHPRAVPAAPHER